MATEGLPPLHTQQGDSAQSKHITMSPGAGQRKDDREEGIGKREEFLVGVGCVSCSLELEWENGIFTYPLSNLNS